MSLQQTFIDEMAKLFDDHQERRSCFLHRFDPANHPDNNKDSPEEARNTKVAELINKDLNGTYCTKNIGHTIKKVLEGICGKYEEEMKADGVQVELLFCVGRGGVLQINNNDESSEEENQQQPQGRFSPWQVVYRWLWDKKFLRFILEYWQEKADASKPWMEFYEEIPGVFSKGLILEELEEAREEGLPKIPLKKPGKIRVFFSSEVRGYFLLLNKGNNGSYVLCPSLGYALDSHVDSTLILPQEEAVAGQKNIGFKYGDLGIEEFIPIAHPQRLTLPWLDVSNKAEEIAPLLTSDRLLELWEELEKQGQWRAFYQAFEVVEPETT